MRFSDASTIVTGGGAGIGEAVARRLASDGASVLVADIDGGAAHHVVEAIRKGGGRAEAFAGDLAEQAVAQACVRTVVKRFGKLDVLISNAGALVQAGDVDTCSIDLFDRTMRINTRSTFLMTKFALPHLRKTRGNIVYTGSITAIVGAGGIAAYAGSKGFIHAFMMAVAMEQARYGVRANAVAPGAVATAMIAPDQGGVISDDAAAQTKTGAAMGRQGTPEEMANVVAFLASAEASYVTGAVFVADGGVVPAQGSPGEAVPANLRGSPQALQ